MRPPAPMAAADVLVTESTYGDRHHVAENPERLLGDVVRRVTGRGGVVLIPAFAVGRTETVLLQDTDAPVLKDGDEIAFLPPVSGG